MIRILPNTTRRAAAVVLAAAVLPFLTNHARAQQSIDLFGPALTASSPLTAATGLAALGATQTGSFGPGYAGTVQIGTGVVDTVTERFDPLGTSNSFTISQTGLAGVGTATAAGKTFGSSLISGGTYNLTLTRTTGFTAGLLGNLTFSLTESGTSVLGSTTGQGLLGAVDLLGLFGTNGVATFQFTVPANATGPLTVNINSTLPVGAGDGSYTFATATVNQVVPEPGTVAAMLLGAGGLVTLRFRRRLAAA